MNATDQRPAMTAQEIGEAAAELWRTWSSGRAIDALPPEALSWMAGEVLSRGWPLRAGDIVLTGASAPAVAVLAGDRLEAVFDGLGSVAVEFVP